MKEIFKFFFFTFNVLVAIPKKTIILLIDGGQSRLCKSAEQGQHKNIKSLAAHPPPPFGSREILLLILILLLLLIVGFLSKQDFYSGIQWE